MAAPSARARQAPHLRPSASLDRSELARRTPTAALSAIGLIAGFGVAVSTGSRPLGGVVIAVLGLICIAVWLERDDRRTAVTLTAVGLFAFAISHVLGLLIGAWPSVLVVSAATAYVCWRRSDARWLGAQRGRAPWE